MADTYTSSVQLAMPAFNQSGWNVEVNANCTLLDVLNPVGDFCCTTTEVPSATLNVKVAGGQFVKADGTVVTYAGTASQAITTATTKVLYLDGTASWARLWRQAIRRRLTSASPPWSPGPRRSPRLRITASVSSRSARCLMQPRLRSARRPACRSGRRVLRRSRFWGHLRPSSKPAAHSRQARRTRRTSRACSQRPSTHYGRLAFSRDVPFTPRQPPRVTQP